MSELNPLRWFEDHFLKMLGSRTGPVEKEIRMVVTDLIDATIMQHSCLDISEYPAEIQQALRDQGFIGEPGEHQPLILDKNKLYLSRFYQFEAEVASMLSSRNRMLAIDDPNRLRHQLIEHFDDEKQKLAALLACTRQFTIVTGGPGTGKTSTVVKILSILLTTEPGLEVKLAAPTGKAAMRLAESIRSAATTLTTSHPVLDAPEVVTLHRLLGMRRDGRSFRHGPDNPVTADLLIVDEASMIDLAMMHRLLGSLKPATRLLLLGDPGQLPSVDTGNVLADLCVRDPIFSAEYCEAVEGIFKPGEPVVSDYKLIDAVCRLERSYRFDDSSGIGLLAKTVRQGKAEFQSSEDGSVEVHDLPIEAECGGQLLDVWSDYLTLLGEEAQTLDQLHAAFARARVLCSHRRGYPGVDLINIAIEAELEARGYKQPGQNFYPGRPILITANDYRLELFNGDIGLMVLGDDGERLVSFPGAGDHGQKTLLASRLPEHETCFAMTVHKAQGSEFDHVLLLLRDDDATDDLLTSRELVYTAVTRARHHISLFGLESTWRAAMQRTSARVSGMTGFLGGEADVIPVEQPVVKTPSAPSPTEDGQLDLF